MESSGKAPPALLFLRKNSAWVPRRLLIGELRPLSILLVYKLHRNRFTGHIIARQIFRLLGFSLPPFLSVKLSLALALSRIIFSPRLLSSFTRTLSFSLTGFICILIIFFLAPFVFKKTFSSPFLFLLGNRETQAPITQTQDTALLTSGELFFIYTCCSALRSVSR